jgi:hypothetical protein
MFFLERKNQRTFEMGDALIFWRARQLAKVFASFFKKKRFLKPLSAPV